MHHPILIAALADDRHRWCPCGAVAHRRYGLRRECGADAASAENLAHGSDQDG